MAVETLPKNEATVLAEERTDLALQRTVIAGERTLMAWVRTAISMIGFGFSIYKFFQLIPAEIVAGNVPHPHAGRNLGLTLIALGTLALAAGAWQHRNFLKQIGAPAKQRGWSLSLTVAATVVVIGVLAFYSALLRVGPF
jgi:putative membrane protein